MSDFNTKLDEVASRLYEAGGIDRELNGYNEERVIVAKQAVIDLILSDVIGEDERPASEASPLMKQLSTNTNRIDWRNELREEQRNTLKGGK